MVSRGCNLCVDGMSQQKQRVWLQKAPNRPPGQAKEVAGGQPAPSAQQPGSQSHLRQTFPNPPPAAKQLQSLKRSQHSLTVCSGAGCSLTTSGAGSRPQPWQGGSACPRQTVASSPGKGQIMPVPCWDLPAPLPAYRTSSSNCLEEDLQEPGRDLELFPAPAQGTYKIKQLGI